MMTKIQLVRCPIDDTRWAADQWNMPLDLLILASVVDRRCCVEILDGTLLSLDELESRIDPKAACIGFSYTALSSMSLKRLAGVAHGNGSLVVVGGQAASGAARSLVSEKTIDAVCIGDGEPTIVTLSRQLAERTVDLLDVPNMLVYDGLRVHQTGSETVDVWRQDHPLRTIAGLQPGTYFSRYPGTNTLRNMNGSRAANVFSKRGCVRHCSFCARQEKQLRLRNPRSVAQEISYLVDTYGVDYVLDTADTWVDPGWISEFEVARREVGITNTNMMVFADTRDIDAGTAAGMSTCGVNSVLLGIESGSERILAQNGKHMTRQQIIDAIDCLVAAGIAVSASFVAGLIGEDEDSLAETIDLVCELSKRPGVLCYGNVIIPLMGSRLWCQAFPDDESWPSFVTRALDYDLSAVRELYVSEVVGIHGGVSTLEHACHAILESSRLPILEYAR